MKEDLCRLIKTISPSEPTADKLRDELTTESANYLLDLLKSPAIFKFIFYDDILFNEVAKRISEFCRDIFIRESYSLLFDLYLDELLAKAQRAPANHFTKFVIFEINHHQQMIDAYGDDEKINELENFYDDESGLLYDQLIETLDAFLEDWENMQANVAYVRMAFETIILLDCPIMGLSDFAGLIANRRAEFTAALE